MNGREEKHLMSLSGRSYFLGTPKMNPSRQHLFRATSTPPQYDQTLRNPECLTCTQAEIEKKLSSTSAPPRLVTDWDEDWEDEEEEAAPPVLTTPVPRRKRLRKEDKSVKEEPIPCQFFEASFAPGPHALALIECLGPVVPHSAIYRIPLEFHNLKPLQPIFHVQNNTALRARVAAIAFPLVKSFPVLISGGYHAQVRLLLPPGLREDEITRYPTVLHV